MGGKMNKKESAQRRGEKQGNDAVGKEKRNNQGEEGRRRDQWEGIWIRENFLRGEERCWDKGEKSREKRCKGGEEGTGDRRGGTQEQEGNL